MTTNTKNTHAITIILYECTEQTAEILAEFVQFSLQRFLEKEGVEAKVDLKLDKREKT